MGKIKSKLARRTTQSLLENGIAFNEDFEKNKKVLGSTMPSKKLRNQIAGFVTRVKRQEREASEKLFKKTSK